MLSINHFPLIAFSTGQLKVKPSVSKYTSEIIIRVPLHYRINSSRIWDTSSLSVELWAPKLTCAFSVMCTKMWPQPWKQETRRAVNLINIKCQEASWGMLCFSCLFNVLFLGVVNGALGVVRFLLCILVIFLKTKIFWSLKMEHPWWEIGFCFIKHSESQGLTFRNLILIAICRRTTSTRKTHVSPWREVIFLLCFSWGPIKIHTF